MSKYSKYRIIEKDKFLIQRKNKYFGWNYIYDTDKTFGAMIICSLIFIIFVVAFIICWSIGAKIPWGVYIVPALAVFVAFISRLLYKHSFVTVEGAKSYIEDRIINQEKERKEKKDKKEKRKNSKIHYMDLETERKEKLFKLKTKPISK